MFVTLGSERVKYLSLEHYEVYVSFNLFKCGPFLDTQICVEFFVELFACTSKITFSSLFILPLPDIPLFT